MPARGSTSHISYAGNFLLVLFVLFVFLGPISAPGAPKKIEVTEAVPPEMEQDQTIDVIIKGNGFDQSAAAKFLISGTKQTGGVNVNSTTFIDAQTLRANVTAAPDAVISKYDIEVQQSKGRRGKGIELFSVKVKEEGCTVPPPVLTPASCLSSLPGCLDSTFGGGTGRVAAPRGMWIRGVAIQPIGLEERIVAVGDTQDSCIANETLWTLARYLPDGTLDTSFGNDGVVYEDFQQYSASAHAVVVQSDNKLVVVGYAPPPSTGQFAVARYNENGSRDLCFGDPACTSGGMVLVPYPDTWSAAEAVALQSDGKIVAAGEYGYYQGGPQSRLGVVRLNPDGTLDTSFNGSGQYIHWPAQSSGNAITVQEIGSEDRIVVAGHMVATKPSYSAALLRLTQAGILDSSFGDSGVVITDFSNTENIYYSVAVDSSNRLIAAGYASTDDWSAYQLAMARYDQDGSLDPSFGSGGKVSLTPQLTKDSASTIGIQPDGRILVAGTSRSDDTSYFAAWRFMEHGALDLGFGTNGWVMTEFTGSGPSNGEAMVQQSDDKFITAGITSDNGIKFGALARYHAGQEVPAHDVAVLSISPSANGATQGDTLTVDVTVTNLGQNAETADVTVTESPDGDNLGTQAVSLDPAETTTLTFTWTTTSSTATGEHILEALATITTSGATDERPANNSQSATVSISPAGSDISLTATGYKVKGAHTVDLAWTGALDVYIYRDGALIATAQNSTTFTDRIGAKGGAIYNYQVCEIGTGRCSNLATVVF